MNKRVTPVGVAMSFWRHLAEAAVFAMFATLLLACSKANHESMEVAQSTNAGSYVPTNANSPSGVAQQDAPGTGDIREGSGAQVSTEPRNLEQRVRAALTSDPAFAAKADNIDVQVIDGRVVLNGTVNSAADKQDIEARVRNLVGETRIENRLRVTRTGTGAPGGQSPPPNANQQ